MVRRRYDREQTRPLHLTCTRLESKRSSELAFAAPGLYPPPGTCRIELLVERVERQDARFGVRALTSWVDANHTVFLSAESTDTSGVDRQRSRRSRVTDIDATSSRSSSGNKRVTALTTASRVTVVGQN